MKLNLFFLCFLFSICANAQIQRQFFGFTLGITNKQQVVNNFKNKGKNVVKKDDDIVVRKLKFGGLEWEEVHFFFHENKLYEVFFNSNSDTYNKTYLDSRRDMLLELLDKKYLQFYDSDYSDEEGKFYTDHITVVKFVYEYYNGKWYQSLIYGDSALLDAINESSLDEL